MSIMATSPTSLVFKVRRCEPELVAPAKPTPHEFKQLSDVDDRERHQVPVIQFYKNDHKMQGRDPVKVIRESLAPALVFYYPFAGRLREGPEDGQKLILECTGEGVMFIEADADVTLEQFGDAPHPPFPCVDQLLCDVPCSGDVLNSPLLLIQVTRLRCGGLISSLRFNHVVSDGMGIIQFINAVAKMAQGASAPSIPPVWQRELLNARHLPRVTCTHHEFDEIAAAETDTEDYYNVTRRCFFFSSTQVSNLCKNLPQHLRKSTTFEILVACMWRCWSIALQLNPQDDVRLIFSINLRRKFNPPLPKGYYGNGIGVSLALTTTAKLCQNPLDYALELVIAAKGRVTEEYVRSLIDLMVIKGRPFLTMVGAYLVSDLTRVGYRDLDFEWGKAVFGGPAKVFQDPGVDLTNYYIPVKNSEGEDGIMVPMCLPTFAMERFGKELHSIFKEQSDSSPMLSKFILSSY